MDEWGTYEETWRINFVKNLKELTISSQSKDRHRYNKFVSLYFGKAVAESLELYPSRTRTWRANHGYN